MQARNHAPGPTNESSKIKKESEKKWNGTVVLHLLLPTEHAINVFFLSFS